MNLFLFLSLLTGILEMGPVFWCMAHGLSLPETLLYPCLYQLGNLLAGCPGFTRPQARACASVLTLALLCLGFGGCQKISYWLVMSASFCLNAARNNTKDDCPAWLKRTFRIGGFVLSPLMATSPWFSLAVCGVAPMLSWRGSDPKAKKQHPSLSLDKLHAATMVFHQMHYFAYTYLLPVLLVPMLGGSWRASIAFGVSWVVYLAPQLLAENWGRNNPRLMFYACHSFLLCAMIFMALGLALKSAGLFIAAWMMTGLGGGSVFCIGRLGQTEKPREMSSAENLGHVLGCMVAVVVSALLPANSVPTILISASAFFVLATVICAKIYITSMEKQK